MKIRTAIVLVTAICNSLFLAALFIALAVNGKYLIIENLRAVAIAELILALALAALGIERLINLREER